MEVRKPDYVIKTPVTKSDKKEKWYTIGAGWDYDDGVGKQFISCQIDLPVQNGRIILVKE